jgi:putative SbcD/Mre11-related phosphoesterase
MEISQGIEIIGKTLWFQKERILVLNDLHIGYEEALYRKGVLVPKFQLRVILEELNVILNQIHPLKIVINGDLKHEFGSILDQEWKDVLNLLDYLLGRAKEVIIIKGNHDPIIQPIANKKNVVVVPSFCVGDVMVVHGDELIETSAKRIIIGHEHPAITLQDAGKSEKYKCFLKGTWQKKELMVVPSFNPLLEGTDVLKEKILSPFLKEINNFDIYVVGDEGENFYFGKVRELK